MCAVDWAVSSSSPSPFFPSPCTSLRPPYCLNPHFTLAALNECVVGRSVLQRSDGLVWVVSASIETKSHQIKVQCILQPFSSSPNNNDNSNAANPPPPTLIELKEVKKNRKKESRRGASTRRSPATVKEDNQEEKKIVTVMLHPMGSCKLLGVPGDTPAHAFGLACDIVDGIFDLLNEYHRTNMHAHNTPVYCVATGPKRKPRSVAALEKAKALANAAPKPAPHDARARVCRRGSSKPAGTASVQGLVPPSDFAGVEDRARNLGLSVTVNPSTSAVFIKLASSSSSGGGEGTMAVFPSGTVQIMCATSRGPVDVLNDHCHILFGSYGPLMSADGAADGDVGAVGGDNSCAAATPAPPPLHNSFATFCSNNNNNVNTPDSPMSPATSLFNDDNDGNLSPFDLVYSSSHDDEGYDVAAMLHDVHPSLVNDFFSGVTCV